jgi:hypothetical protein
VIVASAPTLLYDGPILVGKGPKVAVEKEGMELSEEELKARLEEFQAAQQAYLERTFRWLIEFISAYFPEDSLAVEDAGPDVHFLHTVTEGDKPQGVLVYRFRKALDKRAFFREIEEEYREGLGVPVVLFVDSETPLFEAPASLEVEGDLLEIPGEKLTARIRDLREEVKRRARLRRLKESL